ncbi:MAG: hypothetical protein KJ583_04155 [Nanoarchaeota archaeon]|nr:hypothetical protein [Nanoarchaeota archaeon]MBU1269323.1 hypothetical protein [Nanoarchaeota archaeon]MBU1604486.1 hypothetical protein [Nanoarchaeota archaeon]MBU2443195.1 hypothetical protein [Nanoarchaeota archaeon]
MKGLAIVDKGLEKITLEEIKEIIKTKGEIKETIVLFDIKKEEDLCRLAYKSQSVRRILLLLKKIEVKQDFEENSEILRKELENTNLKKYKSKKIRVECERCGEHNFNSTDVAKEASTTLRKNGFEISLKDSDIIIYIYIKNDEGYICIDYSGKDLSKRDYRIFTKPSSLKGTLAFALVKTANYKEGELFVDPYSESGIIAIEAAICAIKKPVHFYKKEFAFQKINSKFEKVFSEEDKKIKKKVKGIYAFDKLLKNVNDSKKNAKIAGVEKIINFSKTDIEWLDTKFEKKSVDKIVTKLPSESKRMSKNVVEKIYQELFYQAEFILKDEGLVVICSQKNDVLKEEAKKKKFKIIEEQTIFSGQQEHKTSSFQKSL